MMSSRIVFLVAVVVTVLMAATPIATVVSGEGLKVRGTPVPPTSVSSFPVASGDELASGASPAVVMFKDQSRLTLSPSTRVKLEARGGSTCVFLLEGSVKLSIVAGAKMGVCGFDKSLVAPGAFEGQVTLVAPKTVQVEAVSGTLAEGKSPCTGSPTFVAMGGTAAGGGGHAAAIVLISAAAVGGTTAAIVLTRSSESSTSPSSR
jgi:hypothetical protein